MATEADVKSIFKKYESSIVGYKGTSAASPNSAILMIGEPMIANEILSEDSEW